MRDYVNSRKESIKILRVALDTVVFIESDFKYALADGIVAIERQIPKKPTLGVCPTCEGYLKRWHNEELYNHCPSCGQKLDWE